MCGITGAIGYIDNDYVDLVKEISRNMTHRGPDADGLWFSGLSTNSGVIFGHRRLSIIDLNPESNQPFVDSSNKYVITYNGELYNYLELKSELSKYGVQFRTESDTEVVLKSYIYWGSACLERFRGMYAFAIYDLNKKQVFISRDRIGIKPLYYTTVKNANGADTLLFASEVRALLSCGMLQRKIDLTGLSGFLWSGFVPGPNTLIEGVKRLDPGCSIEYSIEKELIEYSRYWKLPDKNKKETDIQELLFEIEKATKLRMISDVPVGVFLSGGVDSSVVTSLAAKSTDTQVKTFNIAFSERKYNESDYAKKIAGIIGTDHTEVVLSESLFRTQLPEALDSLDQPTFDAINTYFISRAVKDAGITVALAGTGGDELFGGYSSFTDIPKLFRAARFAEHIPSDLLKKGSNAISSLMYGKPKYFPHQTRWGKLGECLSAGSDILKLYQLSYALFLPDFINELSNKNCPAGSSFGLPESRIPYSNEMINRNNMLHSISNLELSSFIADRLLIDTDMTSMASSLEVRVPLLDHVVIEKIANIDTTKRYIPLQKKQLLLHSVKEQLDPVLFDRPKAGFELPIGMWCRQSLKEEMTELFSNKIACDAVGLNQSTVNKLWNAYQEGVPGLYWSRIWSIFVLLWWTERHKVSL